MKAVVSKQSIRGLTHMSRLPSQLRMMLAGGWLYDILTANSLEKKFRLMHMAYWVVAHSLNTKQMVITWRPVQ